jgi:hypothetical protein
MAMQQHKPVKTLQGRDERCMVFLLFVANLRLDSARAIKRNIRRG